MYREHIARDTGRCVKAGHAMRARAPLFFFRTWLLLCIARRTGSGCQLSATRTSAAGHGTDLLERVYSLLCGPLREASYQNASTVFNQMQHVHKYGIDLLSYLYARVLASTFITIFNLCM